MANTRAAIREIRKAERRALRNRPEISKLKTLQKKVSALDKADDGAGAVVETFMSALDKAAKRKVIHRNKANRLKASATRKLQQISA